MNGEKLRNPARRRRAGAMRQFPSSQLDSIKNGLFIESKQVQRLHGVGTFFDTCSNLDCLFL
jgi:hypothetical protein